LSSIFADALENNDAIKLYAKLLGWFKVFTPLAAMMLSWKQSLGVGQESTAMDRPYP